jgi:hypothetical protein
MAGLDLAEIVTAKVAGEIASLNGQLEALVTEAVDRELRAATSCRSARRCPPPEPKPR